MVARGSYEDQLQVRLPRGGIGCVGKGVLRIGDHGGPIVSTVHFQVQPNRPAALRFTIPGSVARRPKKAGIQVRPVMSRSAPSES